MLPTFILEPSPIQKRNAYSRSLALPRTSPSPDMEDFRTHLKDLRREAVTDLDFLAERLVETLRRISSVEVFMAGDAQQAVRAIQHVCGTSMPIAVNQSSVLIQEIAPELSQSGFQVIDSYSSEFPLSENRFTDYYQLPRGNTGHLVNSFSTSDLGRLRGVRIKTSGVQDFVALLGVNAISAEDGTIFFVQHLYNISKAFQQARKLVLLVALDKIARGREEARLQALGMGIFGWEVRLLKMGSKGGAVGLADTPFVPSSPHETDLLVIILDNGRKQLLDGPYQDLLTCIGCRACIRSCPTQQFFGSDTGWSPKEYLYYFIQGRNPSLELCLNCGMCRVECPLDIDLPSIIVKARCEQAVRRSLAGTLLGNFEVMGRWGSQLPGLTNFALSHPLPRWIADKTLGISKDAATPVFSRDTLERWLKSRHGGPER